MKTNIMNLQHRITLGLFIFALFVCAWKTQAQPVITNQPASITTNAGVTVRFTAGGTGATGFRWYFSGSNAPVASTAAPFSQLTVKNITAGQAGDYYVVATNGANSTTSSIATLSINTGAPVITHQPANVTISAGSSINLTVSASGTTPLSYRWYFNGSTVQTTGGPNLYIPHIQTSQAGDYYVIVTNGLGSATSSVATVIVNYLVATNPPGITLISHSSIIGDVLQFVLDPGRSYRLQSSPDMGDWISIATVFGYTNQAAYYTNTAATNMTYYYRLVSP